MELICPKCQLIQPVVLREAPPPHNAKAVCGFCGSFIKWLGKEHFREKEENMSDEKFWDRNKGYGVALNEYNGNYSLVASRDKDGVIYKDWVFLSKWQNSKAVPDDKKRPMGIYMGDKQSAIECLEYFLGVMKGRQ